MTTQVRWFGDENSHICVDGTIQNGRRQDDIEVTVWEDGDIQFEKDTYDHGSVKMTMTIEDIIEIARMAQAFMKNKEERKNA